MSRNIFAAASLALIATLLAPLPALAQAVGARVTYGDGHPLAVHPLGTEASLQAIDAAALRSFWQGRYRPERAALVVAGDLSPAELRALVESCRCDVPEALPKALACVVGYFGYYYLYAGNWAYYFSGAWAHQEDQLDTLFNPGFYLFNTPIPACQYNALAIRTESNAFISHPSIYKTRLTN